MTSLRMITVFVSCALWPSFAQVNPDEIRDPELKALEKTHLSQLRAANTGIAQLHFPFAFQLNRYVGLDPKQQVGSDTRGLEFVKFNNRIVMKVTGNYNAAYNAAQLTDNQRAGKVLEEVISPMLGILCREFPAGDDFPQIGFEISFHARQHASGYDFENKEIVVLVLNRPDALAYAQSHDAAERQAILDHSEVYLNGKPYGVVLGERESDPASDLPRTVAAKPVSEGLNSMIMAPKPNLSLATGITAPAPLPVVAKVEPLEKLPPAHESSLDATKDLQKSYQTALDRMLQELEAQAHFVRYAPPAFIPFRHGLYLQLSLTTTLAPTAAGSQYRLAALAFDQHIAHLIRPVLAYFKDRTDFDGIDFSTTVKLASGQAADGNPVSVEFIFPLKLVNAYAEFDSTGQQLIDSSFVLIDGERISLNLQAAEAGSPAH